MVDVSKSLFKKDEYDVHMEENLIATFDKHGIMTAKSDRHFIPYDDFKILLKKIQKILIFEKWS